MIGLADYGSSDEEVSDNEKSPMAVQHDIAPMKCGVPSKTVIISKLIDKSKVSLDTLKNSTTDLTANDVTLQGKRRKFDTEKPFEKPFQEIPSSETTLRQNTKSDFYKFVELYGLDPKGSNFPWSKATTRKNNFNVRPPQEDEFAIEFDYDKQLQTDIQQWILSLQDEKTRLDDKLLALRSLHQYIEQCDAHVGKIEKLGQEASNAVNGEKSVKKSVYDIDPFNRKRINQLITDSVLQIILDESGNVNPFRRQLIRVELYLLLSKLLQSNALFGSELTKSTMMRIDEIANPSKFPSSPPPAKRPTLSKTGKAILSQSSSFSALPAARDEDEESLTTPPPKTPSKAIPTKNNSSKSATASTPSPGGTGSWKRLIKKPSTRGKVTFIDDKEKTPAIAAVVPSDEEKINHTEERLLHPILSAEKKKVEISSRLKPRPSVLFNDKLSTDNYVPGADPKNFFEQDRKLGYQKPRMWFPTPQLEVSNSLISGKTSGGSSQIVEEYLRMKALASYVGDLVIPNVAATASFSPYDTILAGRKPAVALKQKYSHTPGKDLTDPIKYANALKEAMELWTPILGVHKPAFGKTRSYNLFLGEEKSNDNGRQERSWTTSKFQRSFYEETVELPKNDLNDEYGLLPVKRSPLSLHEEMNQRFQNEDFKNKQALQIIATNIDRLISKGYKSFDPKFILILEGNQARQRKLLAKLTKTFIHHKRRNSLALAFGIWSILIVEARSVSKRPYYAQMASCHLMLNWLVKARQRNFKMWIRKWKRTVTWIIFVERALAAVMIQKHFRRVQAREKMLKMHHCGKYLGILSDIKLGVFRQKIKYKFPRVIRDERRMYWIAARMIQTLFRCWIECKEYFKKKRQLILLQSICRMWPKYCYYRRLKATTIKCQACVRRTLQRRKYLKLRRATIIVQKYVRRYLASLWKIRTLFTKWSLPEREMAAAIKIQCRFRILIAKRKIKAKRFAVLKIEWAALVVQRNWYRHKKAFHTFFLMCALRERERQDIAMEKLATSMGRFQCVRRIQRAYRARYKKRIIDNVIKVQCWFRGRMGYFRVKRLRKVWWASRKLHHWAKVRVHRWHRLARMIQRWWWRRKEKRLLKHLWYRAAKQEKEKLREIALQKYNAAARIQAHIKGIWDRRWAKRHRAAMIIQRNFRFFNGLRKWKNWKRESILKDVRKFVGRMLERALNKQVKILVAKHSQMLIKPQALIRGFIVRSIMYRARSYAARLGRAAISIQRFWRKMVAMTKAIEEVMAKRRMDGNPFKKCLTLHEILTIGRKVCHPFYSFMDPRVGMKIPTFLYRLGFSNILDVFQRKDLVYVSDLSKLTVEKMNDLYGIAQKKRNASKDKKQNQQDQDKNKKPKGPPTAHFQLIYDIVKIPFYPKLSKDRELLQALLSPYTEHFSPAQCHEMIKKKFLKRFGKHLQTRATNVARDIMDSSWQNYNNYKAFGEVVTGGHVDRAIIQTQESSQFLTVIEELKADRPYKIADERKWDFERLKACANLMQMAVDKAITLLPFYNGTVPSSFRSKLEKAVARIASFKRKCNYIVQKRQSEKRGAKLKTSIDNTGSVGSSNTSTVNERKSSSNNNNDEDSVTSQVIPADRVNQCISPEDSLDLIYYGQDEDIELEMYASICKVYQDLMERWCYMSNAVQSLKNAWSNKSLSRAFLNERRRQFLNEVTVKYIKEQQSDHVKVVWLKFRKQDVMNKKMSLIHEGIAKRKQHIEAMLQYVQRYHITVDYDSMGFPYYIDERGESSYEMPIYSYVQWLALLKIQNQARKYLNVLRLRKEKRLEEERLALAMAEAKLMEERKKALKGVDVVLNVTDETIDRTKLAKSSALTVTTTSSKPSKELKKEKEKEAKVVADLQLERDVEMMLPWKFQFDYNLPYTNGIWALLFIPSGKDNILQLRTGEYEVVIVFRIRLSEELCDIRSVKGKITKNIPLKRLRQMNYDVGCQVECRYKYKKMFYRGIIVKIDSNTDLTSIRYVVQYEDGELESGLERDAIRPTLRYLQNWQQERDQLLYDVKFIKRRQLHFEKLKRQRLKSYFKMPKLSLLNDDSIINRTSIIVTNPGDSTAIGSGRDGGSGMGSGRDGDLDGRVGIDMVGGSVSMDSAVDEPLLYVADEDQPLTNRGERRDRLRSISFDVPDDEENEEERRQRESRKAVALARISENVGNGFSDRRASKVSSSTKEVKRSVLRVKLRVCRAALQYNWIVITPEDEEEQADDENLFQLTTTSTYTDGIEEVSLVEQLQRQRYREKKMEERRKKKESAKSQSLANTPPEELIFYNVVTRESCGIDEIPLYSIPQIFMIQKVQLRWKMYKSYKLMKKRIHCMPLLDIMEKAIKHAKTIAFIGYELEGLTPFQLLVRAGYSELAEVIQDHIVAMQKPLSSITIEEIAEKQKDDYEVLGVVQTNHVRDLKEFQAWWKKTLPYEREKKLGLFNFYSSPDDPRSIQDCIQQSVELMTKKFVKFIKASQTKTKAACQNLVDQSMFPHSHQQVDTYLRRYADKPELARDSIMDLTNKPTTHTYIDEAKVLKVYKHVALQMSAALRTFQLDDMHKKVLGAIKRAEQMAATAANIRLTPIDNNPKAPPQRLLCSGPEAKAAWILRQDVLQYLIRIITSTIKVQRRVKTFLYNKRWKKFLSERKKSVDLIQRAARRHFAYKAAKLLRAQRDSPWEQLWSSEYNVLYYYNYMTGESQYEEPFDFSIDDKNNTVAIAAPFRPLIRDRHSAALMQAWPFLDEDETRIYYRNYFRQQLPQGSSQLLDSIPDQLLCMICKTRKCVRYCLDCDYQKIAQEKVQKMSASAVYSAGTLSSASSTTAPKIGVTPYCLTCYSKQHPDDDEDKGQHRFQVVGSGLKGETGVGGALMIENGENMGDPNDGKLRCCQCNELATRRCLGPFSDELIEEICTKLRRTQIDQWLNVLKEEKVAGERKLMLLIEGMMQDAGITSGNSSAGDIISYTSNAASSTAIANSQVLLQSIRSVLEKSRTECDESYCTACYQDIHSGGKRSLHLWQGFAPGCQVCEVCHSSPAEWTCVDCSDAEYCDPCFKVFHSMGRKRRHKKRVLLELPATYHGEDEEEDSATRESAMTDATYCDYCTRRLGHYCGYCETNSTISPSRKSNNHKDADDDMSAKTTDQSGNGRVICCEECYEFKHKPTCRYQPRDNSVSPGRNDDTIGTTGVNRVATLSPSQARRKKLEDVGIDGTAAAQAMENDKYAAVKKKDYFADLNPNKNKISLPTLEEMVCVVCNEPADKKCVECNDFYCSKIWMGNPGCFQQFHSKGNRANHTTEVVKRPKYNPAMTFSGPSSRVGSPNVPSSGKAILSTSLDSSQSNKLMGGGRMNRPRGGKPK